MNVLTNRLALAEERFSEIRKKYLRKLPNTTHCEKKIENRVEDKILGCI